MQSSVAKNSVFQDPVDAITKFLFKPIIPNLQQILVEFETVWRISRRCYNNRIKITAHVGAMRVLIGPLRSFNYSILINLTVYFIFGVISSFQQLIQNEGAPKDLYNIPKIILLIRLWQFHSWKLLKENFWNDPFKASSLFWLISTDLIENQTGSCNFSSFTFNRTNYWRWIRS